MKSTTSIGTAEFLRLIHGDEPIHFRVLKKDLASNLHGHLDEVELELDGFNNDGFGVYFVVNQGGTRKVQIKAITAFVTDFDDLSKEEALRVLAGTPLTPTIIVESKRSIHAYWVLTEPYRGEDRLELFEGIQRGLNARLGSDPRVKTAERVMALPGFLHMKDPSDPFMVKVLDVSGGLYEVSDFEEFRREGMVLKEAASKSPRRDQSQGNKGGYKRCEYTYTSCTPLSPHGQPLRVKSRDEAVQALLQIDLAAHLEVSPNCCCPLHEDVSPSASIHQTPEGLYLLTCHSQCGTRNILSLTMEMQGVSFPEALSRLMSQYQSQYNDSDLVANRLALDPQHLKSHYPALYRQIRWHVPALTALNNFVAEVFRKHGFVDADGRPCIMGSYRFLADKFTTDHRKLVRKLNNLVWFGLLAKLSDGEAPSHLLDWARGHGQQGRRVTIWSVPAYTPEFLAQAERKALESVAGGESVSSRTSREGQQRAYGVGAGLRICPQASDDLLMSNGYDMLKRTAESLIKERGYFRDREAMVRLKWKTDGQRRLVQQLRPALLKDLDLEGLQLNKETKKKLAIAWAGYPVVWVPRQSLQE